MDLKVFVDAPSDLRLIRRLHRDVARRGRTVESVTTQYVETVRPMHERFVEPFRHYADLEIPGHGDSDEALRLLVRQVRRRRPDVTGWRSVGAASARRSDRTTEGPPTSAMSPVGEEIGVGKAHWFEPPLPPNRTCGSPASGSPVSGVHGGTDRSARGLRPW